MHQKLEFSDDSIKTKHIIKIVEIASIEKSHQLSKVGSDPTYSNFWLLWASVCNKLFYYKKYNTLKKSDLVRSKFSEEGLGKK